MKRFTLQRLDSKYLNFDDYIAESEEEAISEAKRVWGGGNFKVVGISENLEGGVYGKHFCKEAITVSKLNKKL